MDEDEIKLELLRAANGIVETSRMYKLPGHRSKPTDFGLWKLKRVWSTDDDTTDVHWYKCPMLISFGCQVQIKVIENTHHITLLRRGEHEQNIHAHENDNSKHLKVKQLEVIRTGVRIATAQSARILRGNLTNLSPESGLIQNTHAASSAQYRLSAPSLLWSS